MLRDEEEEKYHKKLQSGFGLPGFSHSVPVSSIWLYGSGTTPVKKQNKKRNKNVLEKKHLHLLLKCRQVRTTNLNLFY